ncbi:MAG: hypothetical protein IPH63_10470 [Flavobacteriales bacterium]|nr:hypothetical protein [Flavobacteriales bacterium]
MACTANAGCPGTRFRHVGLYSKLEAHRLRSTANRRASSPCATVVTTKAALYNRFCQPGNGERNRACRNSKRGMVWPLKMALGFV